jgi:hypothetical protein
MNIHFHSLLAEEITSYLRYKRALGRKFDTEEGTLRLFDRFLVEHAVADMAALQPALIEAFLASRPRRRTRRSSSNQPRSNDFWSWRRSCLTTRARLIVARSIG